MSKENLHELIDLRSITHKDEEFLYEVYADTRAAEMAMTGWSPEETGNF